MNTINLNSQFCSIKAVAGTGQHYELKNWRPRAKNFNVCCAKQAVQKNNSNRKKNIKWQLIRKKQFKNII